MYMLLLGGLPAGLKLRCTGDCVRPIDVSVVLLCNVYYCYYYIMFNTSVCNLYLSVFVIID